MSQSERMPEEEDVEVQEDGRRLSYKFQRLRERIRQAIESGEFDGKLPGERVLARRFKVNAKTLSKALTDLAAEGLLERSIGLGTFVRGTVTTRSETSLLVVHDPDQSGSSILKNLESHAEITTQLHGEPDNVPASVTGPHRFILICSRTLTDEMLRDLVVRGKTVIRYNRPGTSYATHGLNIDHAGSGADIARRMARAGHRELMLVCHARKSGLRDEIAPLLPPGMNLRVGTLDQVRNAVQLGVTGLICKGDAMSRDVMELCHGLGVSVPQSLSIAGIGFLHGQAPCSGNWTQLEDATNAVLHLMREGTPHRPVTLWLAGQFADHGTMGAHVNSAAGHQPALRYAWTV